MNVATKNMPCSITSPRNTSMERTWCSSQRWELLLLSKQLAYIGGSLLGQLGLWLFSVSSWEAGSLYDNDIVQDTHVDWNRQEESACQVWQVLFVSTITLPPPSFMVITCTISMFICNTATCAMMCPILKVRSTLLWSSSHSSSRWCWSRCTGRTWSKARTASMARRAVMARPSLASRSQSKLGRTRKRCQILINNYTCCVSWFEMQGYVLPGGGICGQYWRHRNTHSFWAQRYIEGGKHDKGHIEGGTLSNMYFLSDIFRMFTCSTLLKAKDGKDFLWSTSKTSLIENKCLSQSILIESNTNILETNLHLSFSSLWWLEVSRLMYKGLNAT